MRSNLKHDLGNNVRFQYAQVDCFSNEKHDTTTVCGNRKLFRPTMLLINLYTTQRKDVRKVDIDHMWIHIYPTLLSMNLHINDCISFTARPMKYEKVSTRGNITVEIGIESIFNVQFISRPNIDTYEFSFDYYMEEMIWNKNIIVPDLYLKYYYSHVVPQRNHSQILNGARDINTTTISKDGAVDND